MSTSPQVSVDVDGIPGGATVAAELRDVRKAFPGVVAVDDVSLEIRAGEVHGVVGENGAGKSTLVRMLAGAVVPDTGEVFVGGRQMRPVSPASARRLGVAAIHQEPNVVPALTAVANVFLGQEIGVRGLRDEREMRRRFASWCELLGVGISATTAAGRLTIGARQSVEIMRALEQEARVVIMDEPTAALSHAEAEALHETMGILRARGTAIVLISHKLDEVIELCDTVTVMRDGRKVLSTPSSMTDVDSLVTAMLGSRFEGALEQARQDRPPRRVSSAPPLLSVERLTVPGRLHDVSLSVGRGEVVGIAGLVGAGRSTLLRAIAGLEPLAQGSLTVNGRRSPWPTRPRAAQGLGIALVPENRRTEGLVLGRPAAENIVLASLGSVGRHGFATRAQARREASMIGERVGFASSRLAARAGTLSGGNQQKVVLAKCLRAQPAVLLIDEPARGIDVGAKAEILGLLHQLSAQGMGVVMVSEETEELVAFADRVVVLCRGAVSGRFEGGDAALDAIVKAMFPVS